MELHIIDQTNSIANHFISEMRDISIQGDRLKFRNNMRRLGVMMAYEFSKSLDYTEKKITTPLGIASSNEITNTLYLVTVLRAGLPFYEGFLEVFDKIDSGFIGAYRDGNSEETGAIQLDYLASDDIAGKELLLVDPMLATGNSLVKAYKALLLKCGKPDKIHFFSAVGTNEAIALLKREIDIPFSLWIGSVDEKLNEKDYIIPGLGDAGDLSYGGKK